MTNAEKAQAVLYMQSTPGWELVEQYIRDRAADNRQRLMTDKTFEEVLEHRGEATAFEAVLSFVVQTIREGEEEDAEI